MENTLTKSKLINLKNKTKENDDGTTTIFIESKTWGRKEVLIDTEDLLRLDKEIPKKTVNGKWSVVLSKDSRVQSLFYAKSTSCIQREDLKKENSAQPRFFCTEQS